MMSSTPTADRYFAAGEGERIRLERAFSYSLRLVNGTRRYTYAARLNDVNQWVKALLPHAKPLRLLDVAISSGISTLEWLTSLESAGFTVQMTASDLLLTGHIIAVGERLCLLTDTVGTPLQYVIGHRALPSPPGRRNTAIFFAQLAILRLARRIALPAILGADSGRKFPAPLRHRIRVMDIDFVVPRLRDNPAVRIVQDDVLRAHKPHERYHAIRAANILNRCYFNGDELTAAVHNLAAQLLPGGLLIVCSTAHDETNRGTAFVLRGDGQLEIASRMNGGAEIEELSSFAGNRP